MRSITADRLLAICVICGALAYLSADALLPVMRIGDPLGPRAFPALIGSGLIVSGLLLLLETRRKRCMQRAGEEPEIVSPPVNKKRLLILCAMVAWTALYYGSFEFLGYLLATMLFLLGLLSYFHRGHHVVNIAVAVGFTIIIDLLFSQFLGVPMPTGLLPI